MEPCRNCGLQHPTCCARCGKKVPKRRDGAEHCSNRCEDAQRREDQASADMEPA